MHPAVLKATVINILYQIERKKNKQQHCVRDVAVENYHLNLQLGSTLSSCIEDL